MQNSDRYYNAFMVKGAKFSLNDIPMCPTTAINLPKNLISYPNAKILCERLRKSRGAEFFVDAFVHFYTYAHKYDDIITGIWSEPHRAVEVLRHFAGIITPDFPTYVDFPLPLKIYNIYRMRAFGFWYGTHIGGAVINNVCWGTDETFFYTFDGIERDSMIALETVASDLHDSYSRKRFEGGFRKMLEMLSPKTVIVYGSDDYPWFDDARKHIRLINFRREDSLTADNYLRRSTIAYRVAQSMSTDAPR